MKDDMAELILAKLDKLDDRLDSVDKTLIRQESQLEEHMRRSLAAEKGIDILAEEVKPIQTHVAIVTFSVKLLMVLMGSGGIVALIKLFINK